MRFGIDRLLDEPRLRQPLAGRRVALLAHPAMVEWYEAALLESEAHEKYDGLAETYGGAR